MQNVITLIAPTNSDSLNEKIINKLFILLEKSSARIKDLNWLAANEACDIIFDHSSPNTIRQDLATILANSSIDYILQPINQRRKTLLLCDMDSTIIEQECIDEIASLLGLKEQVATITQQAMNGELDFSAALKERVALLAGIDQQQLEQVYSHNITLTSGAKTLVQTMNRHGATCILVSGGFTFFTKRVANEVGFAQHFANELEIDNSKLTGQVIEPILDKDSKQSTLNTMVNTLNITHEQTMAIGDGANDLPMLQSAGIGVAFHAKPAVQEQIEHHINHSDLTALLFAQGFTNEEFIR